MSLWQAWRWAGVLAKHSELSRWQLVKVVRHYVIWANFQMALIEAEDK